MKVRLWALDESWKEERVPGPPLPKTTRDTIFGNAQDKSKQTKKSRENLALRDLMDPKSKG